MSSVRRRYQALAIVAAGAVALSACGSAAKKASSTGATGGTFVFGAAGAPKLFDPFYATDGETFRVTSQIFEGLVSFKPGTADVAPGLAKSYDVSSDGLTYTFHLQSGVTFSDGTTFDGAAVCANFDRWYNQTGAAASDAVAEYYTDNFGGFADKKAPSLYDSCAASDASTAVVKLTRSTSKFPALLGLPSFAMQSPTAMKMYDANNVQAAGDSFTFPAYATDHPTGTGPFTFQAYDKANNTVTLVRNDKYWGTKAKLDKVVFQIIPDSTARKQALEAGTIDGYDFPDAADWTALRSAGDDVEVRPAFNIFYVGINQKNNPALRDLRVRQALLYAIDRDTLVKSQLPDGANVASQFIPKTVAGYADDVTTYPYDPAKAKALLAAAGASNLTLNFYWPTSVSRPYMPNPMALYGAIAANLKAVGITINEKSEVWNSGYLDDVDAQKPDLFLLGWTGDYNTADNFIGTFFGDTKNRFDTEQSSWGQTLSDDLTKADGISDPTARTTAYQTLNKQIMSDYLPALPISSSPPAIVVSSKIKGLVPSPLTLELYTSVTKG